MKHEIKKGDVVELFHAQRLFEIFKQRDFFINDETRINIAQWIGNIKGFVSSIEEKYKFDYFYFSSNERKNVTFSLPYEAIEFIFVRKKINE